MSDVEKKNRSLTYLLPLALKEFNVNKKAIVNSYLYYEDLIDNSPENGLFIKFLYAEESKDTFKYNTRTKHIEDLNDKEFLVFIEYPIYFKNDVLLLLEGKYSKITNNAKNTIINFLNVSADSKLVKVLTKDPVYKQYLENELNCTIDEGAELGNKFNLNKEVLIIKNVDNKNEVV